jgi:hypothetical protein
MAKQHIHPAQIVNLRLASIMGHVNAVDTNFRRNLCFGVPNNRNAQVL